MRIILFSVFCAVLFAGILCQDSDLKATTNKPDPEITTRNSKTNAVTSAPEQTYPTTNIELATTSEPVRVTELPHTTPPSAVPTEKPSSTASEEPPTVQPTTPSSRVQPTTPSQTENAPNEIVDNFFSYLRRNFRSVIDPFNVPDRYFGLNQRIYRLNIKVQYGFENCKVFGLSTIKRSNNFQLGQSSASKEYIYGKAIVEETILKCTLVVKVFREKYQTPIVGYAKNGAFNVELEQNQDSGKTLISKIGLTKIGKINFEVPPSELKHLLTNRALNRISKTFKSILPAYYNVELAYMAKYVNAHLERN